MTTANWWGALGISLPRLEAVAGHSDANTYALFFVAWLERGESMSLAEVAERFEEAGIADRSPALRSPKRCRPGRPLVYRDGDFYSVYPHHPDLEYWVFVFDLYSPKAEQERPDVVEPEPLRGPETALCFDELDEARRKPRSTDGRSNVLYALSSMPTVGRVRPQTSLQPLPIVRGSIRSPKVPRNSNGAVVPFNCWKMGVGRSAKTRRLFFCKRERPCEIASPWCGGRWRRVPIPRVDVRGKPSRKRKRLSMRPS